MHDVVHNNHLNIIKFIDGKGLGEHNRGLGVTAPIRAVVDFVVFYGDVIRIVASDSTVRGVMNDVVGEANVASGPQHDTPSGELAGV